MNLSKLITESQRLAGRVDADWNDRTKRWLNEAQRQWAITVPWPTLRREESFVADGSEALYLPQRVMAVAYLADETNLSPILNSDFWDKEFPASYLGRTSGSAEFWRSMGYSPVRKNPVYGKLTFSTTTSDATVVSITGLTVNTALSGTADYYSQVSETITINGNTAETSVNEYYSIDTIGKDDFTVADFHCIDQSSNIIAILGKDFYRTEYQKIELMHKPVAGTLIRVQYLARPMPLTNLNQVPHVSVDTEYMIWYTAANIHDGQGQTQEANLKRAYAEKILQKYIAQIKGFGDKDYRAIPEYSYWNVDDDYEVGI